MKDHQHDNGGDIIINVNNYVMMESDHECQQKPNCILPSRHHDDDDDDERSVTSTTSSVATTVGIHDYPGFYCICLVILIGDMSRGVMFPTLWPLVKQLQGSPVSLGYAVAAFSFGRVLVNPLFGYWSDTIGYRKTLFLSCTILLTGTLFYAQIENVKRLHFLIISQMVLGIGSGTLGVTRAFVADVTDRLNRTKYMAWLTAVQYGGFTMTPAIGALFIHTFGDNNYSYMGGLIRLNMFTAPAYFMTVIVSFTMLMMYLYLQDKPHAHNTLQNKSQKRQLVEDYASSMTPFFGLTIYDLCILGCMFLNVTTKGSIACFETLGIALAQDYFEMTASRAGIIIACCGTLGVISLLNMGYLEQRFSDVQVISSGIIVMTFAVAILIFVQDDTVNPSWQYILSICLMYSIGYPIGHTATLGLFSKSKFFLILP
jgi:MFS transporter, ceroid-lipofuscinosis neuronal protein 7